MTNNIYDYYEQEVLKYRKIYGKNTIVLIEVGSFFELYDDGSGLNNMREISDILNIQVSRRNKSILEVSKNNCEMAGFPSHSLKKFIKILTDNNYTIVLIEQVTPPPNPHRKVTDIISPGTNLENFQDFENNNLMTIYIEENEVYRTKETIVSCGCSIIDLTTGKCLTYESSSTLKDKNYALDEIYRLLLFYKPKEIYIFSDKLIKLNSEKIINELEIKSYVHNFIEKENLEIKNINYQKDILNKVYIKTGLLDVIEYLNFERKQYALISFVKLLQFINQHNENLILNILKPIHLEDLNTLLLSYNSIRQLDIDSYDNRNSLLKLINNSKTSVGKRHFKNRLLNPIKDKIKLNENYEKININLQNNNYEKIREILTKVYDIERLFRKCTLNKIHPHEVSSLYYSLKNINLAGKLYDNNLNEYEIDIIKYIDENFVIDDMSLYNNNLISYKIFKKNSELENLGLEYEKEKNELIQFCELLNKNGELVKLEYNEREGYFFTTTSKRLNELKKQNLILNLKKTSVKISDFHTKTLTNNVKLFHPEIEKLSNQLIGYENRLNKLSIEVYNKLIQNIDYNYNKYFIDIIDKLEEIDYITTNCYNVEKFKLTKPEIKDNKKSYLKMFGLRHLIIETIQDNIEYIKNDIELGIDKNGILLYGVNSAGKSSLMKSIGLNIIMAQAGMYVACDKMEYYPYSKIFTRIHSNDNLFKGQSTFTKEIIELRNILTRADENSLVIGDELCSGTESISALSIVSSGIIFLIKKNTSFVFATHLHDLVNISEIKSLDKLKIYHLSVIYDEETKKLIYNRKLQEGNGSTLYGIEVCKSLDLDKDFLIMANKIRQNILGINPNIIDNKRSNYNSKLIVDKCKICGEKAVEVHHIKEQRTANEKGYIDNHHKNVLHNLVSLCSSCHDKIHNKEIDIDKYICTSDGIELKIKKKVVKKL